MCQRGVCPHLAHTTSPVSRALQQRVASALGQVAFYRAQHDQVLSELRDAHEASGSGILGFFKRSGTPASTPSFVHPRLQHGLMLLLGLYAPDKHSQSSRNIRAALKQQEQALAAVEEAAAADGPPPIDPKILWVSYKQMVVELEKQDHSSSEKMEALELALNDRIHKVRNPGRVPVVQGLHSCMLVRGGCAACQVAELSQQLDQARDEAKNAVSHRDRHVRRPTTPSGLCCPSRCSLLCTGRPGVPRCHEGGRSCAPGAAAV